VLAFTPDVEAALQWFVLTHQLQMTASSARWVRTEWPAPGAAGDQDARLTEQLQLLRATFNQIAREHDARERKPASSRPGADSSEAEM
jgi:hypothetical protein